MLDNYIVGSVNMYLLVAIYACVMIITQLSKTVIITHGQLVMRHVYIIYIIYIMFTSYTSIPRNFISLVKNLSYFVKNGQKLRSTRKTFTKTVLKMVNTIRCKRHWKGVLHAG